MIAKPNSVKRAKKQILWTVGIITKEKKEEKGRGNGVAFILNLKI